MGVKPWFPPAPEPVSSQVYLSPPDMMEDNTKKPWMMVHPNLSSSSLRGMEIAVPPPSPGDFPPPAGMPVYERKPLPPVPAGRYSISSAFSREVSNAFQTPKGSMEASQQEQSDWEREEADIAVMLDKSVMPVRANRMHPNIRVSTGALPAAPPAEIVSPQPKKSVPKILRLTGLSSSPLTSPLSNAPSGYNPQHKIRQLMGVDIGSDEYKWEPVSPVSPLTPTSSMYSQDGLEATISEPDESLYTGWKDENDGYVSDSADAERSMLWAVQPGFIPRSLHINKARKTSITSGHPPANPLAFLSPPPASHTRPASGPFIRFHEEPKVKPKRASHHPTLSSSSVDYHISAAEIAYATGTGSSKGHRSQLSTSSAGSAGSGMSERSSISFYSTQSSTGRIQSFSSRDYRSKVRSPPPASLTAVGGAAESGESFGTGEHPLKTPYPQLKSVFDEDDDDDEVSASGSGDEVPNRRRSMMDRVFKKRHGSGGSKGSGSWTRPISRSGSRCGSSDSSSPESRPPMNVTSMARSPSTSQPGNRYVVTNQARRVNGPDTPMPITSAGGRSAFAQRTGDLMEQARAAVGGKSKEEKRRGNLLRKGIQVISEETAREMRIPPPVPPRPLRPLSLVRGGDKISGNWL